MITVIVKLPIQPDQREKFATEVAPFLEGPNPAGCISVECFESIGEPDTFLLLELWESEQALDAWHRSETFQALLRSTGPQARVDLRGAVDRDVAVSVDLVRQRDAPLVAAHHL